MTNIYADNNDNKIHTQLNAAIKRYISGVNANKTCNIEVKIADEKSMIYQYFFGCEKIYEPQDFFLALESDNKLTCGDKIKILDYIEKYIQENSDKIDAAQLTLNAVNVHIYRIMLHSNNPEMQTEATEHIVELLYNQYFGQNNIGITKDFLQTCKCYGLKENQTLKILSEINARVIMEYNEDYPVCFDTKEGLGALVDRNEHSRQLELEIDTIKQRKKGCIQQSLHSDKSKPNPSITKDRLKGQFNEQQ